MELRHITAAKVSAMQNSFMMLFVALARSWNIARLDSDGEFAIVTLHWVPEYPVNPKVLLGYSFFIFILASVFSIRLLVVSPFGRKIRKRVFKNSYVRLGVPLLAENT